jgi:hypothetical protein
VGVNATVSRKTETFRNVRVRPSPPAWRLLFCSFYSIHSAYLFYFRAKNSIMSDETLRSDIEDSEPDAFERGSITSGFKNLDQNQPGRDALCNYSMKPLQMQQPASGGKRVRDSDSEFQSHDLEMRTIPRRDRGPKPGSTWTFKLQFFTKLN